jgi:hypothetical protein
MAVSARSGDVGPCIETTDHEADGCFDVIVVAVRTIEPAVAVAAGVGDRAYETVLSCP